MTEKWGGNIILNRLICSKYYVSRQNSVYLIEGGRCHFGNAKYNDALRELENYLIDKYNLYVVDISKYFIPDEAHTADTTPVHYEPDYVALQSKYMKEIILDKTANRYCDVLPIEMMVKLLQRPVSEDDFIKIYEDRELPFSTGTLLDELFKNEALEQIASNRMWITKLYSTYALGESAKDGIKLIIENRDIWGDAPLSLFQTKIYNNLNILSVLLQLAAPALYELFVKDFEESNTELWMWELRVLWHIAPDYKDVPRLIEQYYTAINDEVSLRKLRLENTF